jgi:hypothetical protein
VFILFLRLSSNYLLWFFSTWKFLLERLPCIRRQRDVSNFVFIFCMVERRGGGDDGVACVIVSVGEKTIMKM